MRRLRTINGFGIYQNNKREIAECGFAFTILHPNNMECVKDSGNYFTPSDTEMEFDSLDDAIYWAEHYDDADMEEKECSIADLELKYSWIVKTLKEAENWHVVFYCVQRHILGEFPKKMTAAETLLSLKEINVLFAHYFDLRKADVSVRYERSLDMLNAEKDDARVDLRDESNMAEGEVTNLSVVPADAESKEIGEEETTGRVRPLADKCEEIACEQACPIDSSVFMVGEMSDARMSLLLE